jgi:hypothetical protein
MTSPYVTSPYVAAPARSHPVLRALLAVSAVVLGVVGFLIAGAIGLITWTGCFIGCTGENHAGGAALALLAVVSLASGPAAVSGLYRSAAWMRAAAATAAAGVVLALLVLGAN